LSTFFWMATLLAYAYYVERPGWSRYLLVVLMLALGLSAKPMLVTLPCVLLLLDGWPLARLRPQEGVDARRLVVEKLPLLALAAVCCVLTLLAQEKTRRSLDVPFAARVGNALVSYVAYGMQMIWPDGLAVFYPHPRGGLPAVEVAGAAVLLTL